MGFSGCHGSKIPLHLQLFLGFFYQFGDRVTTQEKELGQGKFGVWLVGLRVQKFLFAWNFFLVFLSIWGLCDCAGKGAGTWKIWFLDFPGPNTTQTHTTPEYSGKGQGKEDLQVCKEWEIKEREQSRVLSSFPSFFLDVSSVEPFSPLDTWSCGSFLFRAFPSQGHQFLLQVTRMWPVIKCWKCAQTSEHPSGTDTHQTPELLNFWDFCSFFSPNNFSTGSSFSFWRRNEVLSSFESGIEEFQSTMNYCHANEEPGSFLRPGNKNPDPWALQLFRNSQTTSEWGQFWGTTASCASHSDTRASYWGMIAVPDKNKRTVISGQGASVDEISWNLLIH